MNKIHIIVFGILTFFFSTFLVIAKANELSLVGKVFIIDPGHGGKDAGTHYKEIYEKDINLAISLKLIKSLLDAGATVYITRDGDYDLSSPDVNRRKKSDFDNRIDYINKSGADLYFSIHINYLDDSRYSGAQVFYIGDAKLANEVQKSFNYNLNSTREAKTMSNNYYMYKKLTVPGILIECGFLSNPQEREYLRNEKYQEKLVDAIVEGLYYYY